MKWNDEMCSFLQDYHFRYDFNKIIAIAASVQFIYSINIVIEQFHYSPPNNRNLKVKVFVDSSQANAKIFWSSQNRTFFLSFPQKMNDSWSKFKGTRQNQAVWVFLRIKTLPKVTKGNCCFSIFIWKVAKQLIAF